MAAYRQVYDSPHLQADCQNRDQLRNLTLGNQVWVTFTFLPYSVQVKKRTHTILVPTSLPSTNLSLKFFHCNT